MLRNEYRLLTDEAEAFLRASAVEKYYPGVADAARLKRILESGNTALFQKEFDALSIKYNNDLLFWQLIDPVYLLYFITSDQISVPHFERISNKIDEIEDRLSRHYNRYLSDYEVKRAYTHKVHSILTDTLPESVPSKTVETKAADDLVEYRKLKARTYYITGKEKIKTLLAAEKILKKKHIPQLGMDETWWLKANIGLEYHLLYDFKNAIQYFDTLFKSPGIETFNRLPETALNYLSSLMSNGDYEKAVKVISDFEGYMAGSPAVFYKYICLKSLALSFLNKPQQARKELNRVEKHAVEFDFLYWRVAMVLSFAKEQRWEEAQNEFKNLQKTKTVKQNVRSDLDNLGFVLDNMIKIGLAIQEGKKVSASVWKACDEKLESMVKSPGDFLHPPRLIKKILEELNT